MRPTGLSLDDEIAKVEARLAQRRAQLRLLAAEARSRVSMKSAFPVALVGALAIGFAASRFMRRPSPRPMPMSMPRGSRPKRMLGALAASLLPPLIRPLQAAVIHWLAQRMSHSHAHGS